MTQSDIQGRDIFDGESHQPIRELMNLNSPGKVGPTLRNNLQVYNLELVEGFPLKATSSPGTCYTGLLHRYHLRIRDLASSCSWLSGRNVQIRCAESNLMDKH